MTLEKEFGWQGKKIKGTWFKNHFYQSYSQLFVDIKKKSEFKMMQEYKQITIDDKNSKRRLHTDCNYSVFTTLMMRFLKENDLYKASRRLAKANRVSEEKNYSIIFLRIGLYIFDRVKKHVLRADALRNIFEWLESQIDSCVLNKYKDNPESFQQMVKDRSKELLAKIKRVFEEGDFNSQLHLRNLVIDIYEKKGTSHTKTHQKMAGELARLIAGVAKHGPKYSLKKQKAEIESKMTVDEANSFQEMSKNDQQVLSTDNSLQLESLCQPEEWKFFGTENYEYPVLIDFVSERQLEEQADVMDFEC